MRLLELLLTLAIASAVAVRLLPRLNARSAWLGFLPIALAIAQIAIEGYRWQLVPLYVMAVALALLTLRRAAAKPASKARTIVGGGLAALLLIAAAAPAVLFPVSMLPKPNGAFAIGTRSFVLRDAARDEIYTDAPGDMREVMVQVWYPAAPGASGKTSELINQLDVAGPAIAQRLNLPRFILDHAGLFKTNSLVDAPLNPSLASYPVVIYSHGWTGFRTINTDQTEMLASQGYVVFAIDHTYGAMITVFPDGRTVGLRNSILDGKRDAAFTTAFQELVAVYAGDISLLLNELDAHAAGRGQIALPDLKGRLDLARLGIFGHSTGGAATARVCATDPRCKAAVGQDVAATGLPDALLGRGLQQPWLALFSEQWRNNASWQRFETLALASKTPVTRAYIQGTQHYDFILIGLLTPLATTLKLKGSIDTQRGLQINRDALLLHFDQTLRSKGTGAIGLAEYAEVQRDTLR